MTSPLDDTFGFPQLVKHGISTLRGSKHLNDELVSSRHVQHHQQQQHFLQEFRPKSMPGGPECSASLQELRDMGERLSIAEARIQRALRAKLLLETFTKLQKEAKRLDAGISVVGGMQNFSPVERALGLDKIQPELPVVEQESDKTKAEEPSTHGHSRLQHAKHYNRSARDHMWRFIPDDPNLDLQSLVVLGKLSDGLFSRLQSMLSASHLVRLLRMLVRKVGGGNKLTTAERRLREIQCRLEDDIMFFYEEMDVERATPSRKVGLVIRVCAESMRQLWPHITGDTGSPATSAVSSLARNATQISASTIGERSPGPLVQLFVELSLQPLLNWRRLFTDHDRGSKRLAHVLQENSEDRDVNNFSDERQQLVFDQLTDLLRRAKRLLLHRLRVLRISLGKQENSQSEADIHAGPSGTGKFANGYGFTAASAPSSVRVDSASLTHRCFIDRLVHAVYFDEECGIAKATEQVFLPQLERILQELDVSGREKCDEADAVAGSFHSDNSGVTRDCGSSTAILNDMNSSLKRFFECGGRERLIEAYRIAWMTVKEMRASGEDLAATIAADCLRKKFRHVLAKYVKVEAKFLQKHMQYIGEEEASEESMAMCEEDRVRTSPRLTKARLEVAGKDYLAQTMGRIVEIMFVELDSCFVPSIYNLHSNEGAAQSTQDMPLQFGNMSGDVSKHLDRALRSGDAIESICLRESVRTCRTQLYAIWCDFVDAVDSYMLCPRREALQYFENFSFGSESPGFSQFGVEPMLQVDNVASSVGQGVKKLKHAARVLFDIANDVACPYFRATSICNSSSRHTAMKGEVILQKRPNSSASNISSAQLLQISENISGNEFGEASDTNTTGSRDDICDFDILSLSDDNQIFSYVQKRLKKPLRLVQRTIEHVITLCWLQNCTIAPALKILHTKQQKNDFCVGEYLGSTAQLSDSPTDACNLVCELWKRRRIESCGADLISVNLNTKGAIYSISQSGESDSSESSQLGNTGFLEGKNCLRMERTLRKYLVNLIWDHVQTQKVDFTGAMRLQVDIESYMRASQSQRELSPIDRHARHASSASSLHADSKSGNNIDRTHLPQKSFELLRTIAGMMAVSIEHIPDLVKEIPGISVVGKDDFLAFIKCRADFSEKTYGVLTSWIEEFYNLGGMCE